LICFPGLSLALQPWAVVSERLRRCRTNQHPISGFGSMDNQFNYSHSFFVKMGSRDPRTEPSQALELHPPSRSGQLNRHNP